MRARVADHYLATTFHTASRRGIPGSPRSPGPTPIAVLDRDRLPPGVLYFAVALGPIGPGRSLLLERLYLLRNTPRRVVQAEEVPLLRRGAFSHYGAPMLKSGDVRVPVRLQQPV
jgi:hypothetical protein